MKTKIIQIIPAENYSILVITKDEIYYDKVICFGLVAEEYDHDSRNNFVYPVVNTGLIVETDDCLYNCPEDLKSAFNLLDDSETKVLRFLVYDKKSCQNTLLKQTNIGGE